MYNGSSGELFRRGRPRVVLSSCDQGCISTLHSKVVSGNVLTEGMSPCLEKGETSGVVGTLFLSSSSFSTCFRLHHHG